MFLNRTHELKALDKFHKKGKLAVLYGRRRVGKTTLVEHWARDKNLLYSQALEGAPAIQISQLVADLAPALPEGIVPVDWPGLLAALSLAKGKYIIAIDEFPYLTESDPSVASLWQAWIDHRQPANLKLILLGSSQSMMHGLFLAQSSPLFDRAQALLHIEPMGYREFCEAHGVTGEEENTFLKFAMVGGVPQYWDFFDADDTPCEVADSLFFGKSARLQNEADRLLKDEKVEGIAAKSILEAIGRGAAKPSEIGGRMAISQTNLSRPLQVLLASSLVSRMIPFGESIRTTKRVLYEISDPALHFWYNTYSPHRSRWHLYDSKKQLQLLRGHAAWALEHCYRQLFPDASRYWEGDTCEFDAVRHADSSGRAIILSEIKWQKLTSRERASLRSALEHKFSTSRLRDAYRLADVEILDFNDVVKALLTVGQ